MIIIYYVWGARSFACKCIKLADHIYKNYDVQKYIKLLEKLSHMLILEFNRIR